MVQEVLVFSSSRGNIMIEGHKTTKKRVRTILLIILQKNNKKYIFQFNTRGYSPKLDLQCFLDGIIIACDTAL